MTERYEARRYWSERLESRFDLSGTGHQDYSPAYNEWLYKAKHRALDRALKGVILPGDRVLDIGSGTGWVVENLLRRGAAVTGCDIAPVSVERLSDRFPDTTFHQCQIGAEPLPGEDGSYDIVTAMDVIYHVTDDQAFEAGLAEIARVLGPGGHLVATDRLGEENHDDADHVRFRSRRTWDAAAGQLGLERVRVVPMYRWLSGPRDRRILRRIPDRVRGPLEYFFETAAPVR
ncbi:MAG: class I SAM-dependent methyltransferase, partial [Thermoleophilaceae bacterium]|nr:class I SAM-dependent methyltransferase [Thermoleophilaceae bacterium]